MSSHSAKSLLVDFRFLGPTFPSWSLSYNRNDRSHETLVENLLQWVCEKYNQQFSKNLVSERVYLETNEGIELPNNKICEDLGDETYFLKMVFQYSVNTTDTL